MHFLLVNLYAPAYTHCDPATTRGVPISIKADINAVLRCSSVEQVYKQVLEDIDSAAMYMNVERWDEGLNYRFSTPTTNALRARVALYMGNWSLALQEAKTVIGIYPDLEDMNSSSMLPTNYKSVESIMALEQVITSSLMKVGYVDPALLEMYRSGDSRKTKYFYASNLRIWQYRERNTSEERCTFRAAEFYLIAAEAANELDNQDEALRYINTLMEKRYTAKKYPEYSAALDGLDRDALRVEIANERQREFAYQGHRWFDLRRTTQPELKKSYEGEEFTLEFTLEQGDERYTLRFPSEAVAANPEIENWQ